MRLESLGPQPVEQTLSFETRGYVSVTNGKDHRCFYDKEKDSDDPRFPPIGFLQEKITLPETKTIHLRPLFVLYRPSIVDVAELDPRKFTSKGRVSIAGRDCELLERLGGGRGKEELVVDMKRDCVPVRVRRLLPDGSGRGDGWYATSIVEIDYIDEPDGTWRPKGWKTAILGEGGKLREQMKSVVKKFEINAPIPDSVFEFDFPSGTIITNRKTKEVYLVRESGEKRPVTRAELGDFVSQKQLLETDPGGGSRRWSWLVALLAGTALLVIILVLARSFWLGRRKASKS
jgi:hypothetical protein